jgi:hypothetical protein
MAATLQSRRYRVAISFGLRPEGAEGNDREFMELFERAVDELLGFVPGVHLTQKGIIYSETGSIKNLRPRHFKRGGLADYGEDSRAAQASFYVFDALTPTEVPRFLAHAHSFSRGRIGNIPLGSPKIKVGRFALLALDSSRLGEDGRRRFDEIGRRLHEQIGGVKGGLLIDRGYVWNGKGGLEWAYREIPQMIPSGDITAWEPPFDRMF